MPDNCGGSDADMDDKVSPTITETGSGQMGMAGGIVGQHSQLCCGVAVPMAGCFCRLNQCLGNQSNRFHVHAVFGRPDVNSRT